jgi:antitoxin component YwqK of YwqJK toxin-antitoxin module
LGEYLRPVRKYLNKERNYWSDKIKLSGDVGSEIIYYKNGRVALERIYSGHGLLTNIDYFGRHGEVIRSDSLVYSDEGHLVAGYYFSEPEHKQILKFLNYKQQGQLSQRSWFGTADELLSREFYLFDRKGHRRSHTIFDGNDTLLYSESYKQGSDQLEIQNTYAADGTTIRQTRFETDQPPYQYEFDESGVVTKISELYDAGSPAWTSELYYNPDGSLDRSHFSTNNRFLFTYLGGLELYEKKIRSWRHPSHPNISSGSVKMNHRNPFVIEKKTDDQGLKINEYRLPASGALFKRSTFDALDRPISDTLYSNRTGFQVISVINYDTLGFVNTEVTYNLADQAKWRHTWFRDDEQQIIREELTELPNTFREAVTRFYDYSGQAAMSEKFSSPDSFDGSWLFYHGGGIEKTMFYNSAAELKESWFVRPSGDTVQHSRFQNIDYFKVESKLGPRDKLLSHRRFTEDGLLNWEVFFDEEEQLSHEIHRKNDGSIFREVNYDRETRIIKSTTYAPIDPDRVHTGEELKGELSAQLLKRLNADGEVVQIISRNSSGQKEWERRYAFKGGLLVRSAQLGSDGIPEIISKYTHNENGQILSESAYDREDSLAHTVEYRYGENHELILKTFVSNVHKKNNSNRLYYDELGRVQRDETIEDQRFVEAIEYEYFPEFFLRVATHTNPGGMIIRKEIENYFEGNIFNLRAVSN